MQGNRLRGHNIIHLLKQRVKRTIGKFEMIHRGDLVIVAVSGGPDSVFLLDVLHALKEELEIDLVVAHFDHGLRPGEDHRETSFVKDISAHYGLPFVTERCKDPILGTRGSLEDLARDARYEFLYRVRKRYGADKIALGHTQDDQAETVVMRLLRGSGTGGLAGIPPKRDNLVIRPAIEVSRPEIEAYLRKSRLESMLDSSNLDTRFLRNKIRLELMPLLRQFQPKVTTIFAQTAEILREEDDFLNSMAMDWIERHVGKWRGKGDYVVLPLHPFLSLHKALQRRVLRAAIRLVSGDLKRLSLRHLEECETLLVSDTPHGQIDLPRGTVLRKSYNQFSVSSSVYSKGNFPLSSYIINGPGRYILNDFHCEICLKEIDRDELNTSFSGDLTSVWSVSEFERSDKEKDFTCQSGRLNQEIGNSCPVSLNRGHSNDAFLDMDLLSYPFEIRGTKPGDRFIPLGMHGHKKLKDFFIDMKVPVSYRKRIPILTFKDKPVWVCGSRIDERFKITDDTKRVLWLRIRPIAP